MILVITYVSVFFCTPEHRKEPSLRAKSGRGPRSRRRPDVRGVVLNSQLAWVAMDSEKGEYLSLSLYIYISLYIYVYIFIRTLLGF